MTKNLTIKNSTAEFLIFTTQAGKDNISVRVENETVWLTQKLVAQLFECSADNISLHLKNIFQTGELDKNSVTEDFSVTATDGKNYNTKHYNLKAVIALGYRINSQKATDFRKWATQVLERYSVRGYVLDDVRLKNGAYLNPQYFKDLILEIRDIRESERNFYQQITDIYATAMDYDLDSNVTKDFFATVQNKLHCATHGNTAAELMTKRADHQKDFMGLVTWKKAPNGKILKSDVVVAKNYLGRNEIKTLNRVVTMYLDYAEDQAEKGVPMTMYDWSEKLNAFLRFNDREVLEECGQITAAIAKSFAHSEFEKYRPIQDKLFESDFDKVLKKLFKNQKQNNENE
ncbi:virulence RhuM family protein [Bathymodiolus thermophilus thioautotrophic gill symbiont]|uniref:DNA-binding protein in cluster with Type I restriction-modification system n=2 Tax=Bathymodiolus thermophilus thioautotrophic gill symbiont TaxID=2360 RepID=A0A8H9CGZ3_9GAMM|nr:virulence RhuM family protein [Bathymodiolus thermophilus thioautotrophic gill symbiont]CAB5501352.1 Putative DNA-binding protein in cluster with Type I restriction-modification system [Bathymodiolus thermophilus thioautotrophic gill symbiont]